MSDNSQPTRLSPFPPGYRAAGVLLHVTSLPSPIDSFDQWRVEFSKVLAQQIIPEIENTAEPQLGHDSSTNNLIRRYRTLKETL
jgi:phosphoglucose isomerase-like protein